MIQMFTLWYLSKETEECMHSHKDLDTYFHSHIIFSSSKQEQEEVHKS